MHRIEQLQITDDFMTTVEMTGPDDATECIIFSHGFGVGRDSRGMFTDLVSQLSGQFLCIQFDYVRHEGGVSYVESYQHMLWTLMKVLEYATERYQPRSMHVIGHSMGCILAADKSTVFHKQLYLAPPTEPMADRLRQYFTQNPEAVIDEQGNIIAKRSDGSTTYINRMFFNQLRPITPMDQYAMTNGDIVVIQAQEDEIINNHPDIWGVLGNFSVLQIPGDHNFSAPCRERMVQTVVDYLGE